jgi:hypothetical protein
MTPIPAPFVAPRLPPSPMPPVPSTLCAWGVVCLLVCVLVPDVGVLVAVPGVPPHPRRGYHPAHRSGVPGATAACGRALRKAAGSGQGHACPPLVGVPILLLHLPPPSSLPPHSSLLPPHSSLLTPHSSLLTPHSFSFSTHCSFFRPPSSCFPPYLSLLSSPAFLLLQVPGLPRLCPFPIVLPPSARTAPSLARLCCR